MRLGDSGAWLADVAFGNVRRTLQLTQDHWLTPVSEIVLLAAYFPPPKPVVKKPKASAVPDEGDEDSELELEEEIAEASEDDGEEVNDLETASVGAEPV